MKEFLIMLKLVWLIQKISCNYHIYSSCIPISFHSMSKFKIYGKQIHEIIKFYMKFKSNELNNIFFTGRLRKWGALMEKVIRFCCFFFFLKRIKGSFVYKVEMGWGKIEFLLKIILFSIFEDLRRLFWIICVFKRWKIWCEYWIIEM